MLRSIRNILLVFLFILAFYLLKVLSTLILPLVFATLVVIMYQPLMILLRKYKFPTGVIVPIIAILTISIILVIISIFTNTIDEIVASSDTLVIQLINKLENIVEKIDVLTNSRLNLDNITEYILDLLNKQSISKALGSIVFSVGNFSKSFFIFILYFVILLGSMTNYKQYISYVVKDNQKFLNEIESLQKSISTYMTIKVIISCITGIIVYLVCFAFGVPFSIFFGFLTFLLNFVPSIGSIIATIPPVLMAFIHFDTYRNAIIILIILGLVQMSIGNFIEPKIMGDKLRLNTVTVIFGLIFWGIIWGIPGMLLSVPLLVILKLILEYSDTLSVVARIMGSHNKKT